MKKLTIFSIIFFASLTLMGNSQAKMDGILLKDYPASSFLKVNLNLVSPLEIGDIFILPEDPFDEVEAAAMISRVDRIPSSLLNKIYKENIHIKLFSGKLTDNPTASHLQGIIPRGYTSNKTWDEVPGIGGSRTVLVKIGSSEKGNGHGSVNLELHELAHSIDRHVYNGIRFSHHFLDVWNKEKGILFPGIDYFLNYPEEYFAESFAMFYVNEEYRAQLKDKAPLTFVFIDSLK
ncbi:anthrax toxin lethal factor-related metalloendopeptidase [Cytobacillus gottheilii]|uniref:anthrax toxin lethal factor-related metalloendopeptidase n=1 Tax=Cytobacillus gottheilii TaxID=859144 RepID=UPI0009B94FFA|nr:toxin [Cytobacillus gottheilii]